MLRINRSIEINKDVATVWNYLMDLNHTIPYMYPPPGPKRKPCEISIEGPAGQPGMVIVVKQGGWPDNRFVVEKFEAGREISASLDQQAFFIIWAHGEFSLLFESLAPASTRVECKAAFGMNVFPAAVWWLIDKLTPMRSAIEGRLERAFADAKTTLEALP